MNRRLISSFLILVCLFAAPITSTSADVIYTEDEIETILSHGPWPPPKTADKTNRFSGNEAAIDLGRTLFFDKGLSSSGSFSCASCHSPGQSFTDGRKTAMAVGVGFRNTPSLLNARFQHWYGWAGSVDTLWGASLRAILNPIEMASTDKQVADYIRNSPSLNQQFLYLFGPEWADYPSAEKLVSTGKLIAAFTETLYSAKTPFDKFREALALKNQAAMATYPEREQRGLKLFVGKGNCSLCHFGPLFTNLEFADAGIPYFIKPGLIDKGRYQGIKDLKASPYSSLGLYSDDRSGSASLLARHVTLRHRNWGEFKVPSLRSVSKTAPYMHNGSLKTLKDVIDHYSELNEERLHVDGVAILRPLSLTAREKEDLLAFLKSL